MKTATKTRKPAKKPSVRSKALAAPRPQVCNICGGEPYARWNDDKTGQEWLFCKSESCKQATWEKLPWRVQDRFTQKPRPVPNLDVFLPVSELEIVKFSQDGPVIKGKPAQACWNAWVRGMENSGVMAIYKLYDFKPRDRYMVFSPDGELVSLVKTFGHAEALAGKKNVVVFWGGR